MVLPRKIRQQIEKQDFDTVEMAWLERLESASDDASYYTSVARALVGAGERERARNLLELVDEQMRENSDWDQRLEMLRRAGEIIFSGSKLHPQILETLREVYAGVSTFEKLLGTVGLDKPGGAIGKTWDKVGRLESLLRFDEGVIVYMEGKGVGRIVEVNHLLESFKVSIDGKGELRVGFRAAAKVLQTLPEGHVLARKVVDPTSVAALSPQEILSEVLSHFSRPMTAADIRDALHGLVSTSRWSSWWTAARKHPQIVASHEVRNAYQWAESSADAITAQWKTFEGATSRAKLDVLRRVSDDDEELQSRMASSLIQLTRAAVAKNPVEAFELGIGLERAGVDLDDDQSWTPVGLVRASADPLRLIDGIESRAPRETLYAIIRRERSDWPELYKRALGGESDPKLLVRLTQKLETHDPKLYRKAIDRCLAQPSRAAGLFTWIAERAREDEELLGQLGIRLFKKVVQALAQPDFSTYVPRLLSLFDSGQTLPKLVPLLDANEAADAKEALMRAVGLPRDRRDPLLTALEMKFPELRDEQAQPFYALEASIREKREDLRKLLEDDIPTNRKAIETAREMGDLRENFEYKAARQRHEFLTALAYELDSELARAQIVDPVDVDTKEVRVGTVVSLRGDDGKTQKLRILGPWESAPENGIVSYQSDLGQSLLGKAAGERVEVAGNGWQIEAIAPLAP